ncbi:recombinase family protein [Breznakia pachnodae]|uniref:DNA invertase Pin-like site-specific DNA recombinase n=1 Tax=Breznakia pachnodae TaxID=265178 RepID=A0ABU0DZE2_9FIRM|nr:recombinase family protein [Breznakia pachnodae]MDQ0359660.1 DNA invertase Pin-like site-specific DNA recombinase [Breznakia pachnodae]
MSDDKKIAVYCQELVLNDVLYSTDYQKQMVISFIRQHHYDFDDVVYYIDQMDSFGNAYPKNRTNLIIDIQHNKIKTVIVFKFLFFDLKENDLRKFIRSLTTRGIQLQVVNEPNYKNI